MTFLEEHPEFETFGSLLRVIADKHNLPIETVGEIYVDLSTAFIGSGLSSIWKCLGIDRDGQ